MEDEQASAPAGGTPPGDDAVGRLLAEIRSRAADPFDAPARRGRGSRRSPSWWSRWSRSPWSSSSSRSWPERRVPRRAVVLVALLAAALAVAVAVAQRSSAPSAVPAQLARPPRPRRPAVSVTTTAASSDPARRTASTIAGFGDPLVSFVPAAWRPRCRPAAVLAAAATAGVVCEPGGVVDRVELWRYPDRGTLSAAVARLARGVAVGGADGRPRCAAGGAENRSWRRPNATAPAGRYVCRRDAAGAQLAWSDTARGMLVQATRTNGDLASLFAWWTRAPL